MRLILPLLLAACTENKLQSTIDSNETAPADDSAPPEETVPAEDTAPADDSAPPEDTAPPQDTAPPEDTAPPLRESCLDILQNGESKGDGNYTIDPPCGDVREVYCDMTTDDGGWTRITDLDFSVDACPGDWQAEPDLPLCSRLATTEKEFIRAAAFEAWCIPHTGVRGQLVAYQYYTTDAFGDFPPVDLNDTYGDVVSFTAAGEHLFSYTVGFKSGGDDDSNCPGSYGGAEPPKLVGDAWLCGTGNTSEERPGEQWYTDTPLFAEEWFQVAHKETDADIDGRIIATHDSANEDIGVASLTLFVR